MMVMIMVMMMVMMMMIILMVMQENGDLRIRAAAGLEGGSCRLQSCYSTPLLCQVL